MRDLCDLSAEISAASMIITGLSNGLDEEHDHLTTESLKLALFGFCPPGKGAPTPKPGGRNKQKKGVEIMTERDLRRYEIMDQYGVDEDTAELMLIDEEEEEECEHQNKGII